MAIKGLAAPIIGVYSNNKGTVKYANAVVAGAAVEYGVSWETSDDNPLYADNMIKENDSGTFQSGELTLGTDDLTENITKVILGLKTKEVTYGSSKKVSVTVYDDDARAPYFGFGIVESHQIDNADHFRAVFLPKVQFKLPENTATTKGESIEWQTPSITAAVLRSDQVDDNGKHPWMEDAWFDNEADAIEYLIFRCGGITVNESEGENLNE